MKLLLLTRLGSSRCMFPMCCVQVAGVDAAWQLPFYVPYVLCGEYWLWFALTLLPLCCALGALRGVQNIGLACAPMIISGMMPSSKDTSQNAYLPVEWFFVGLGGTPAAGGLPF